MCLVSSRVADSQTGQGRHYLRPVANHRLRSQLGKQDTCRGRFISANREGRLLQIADVALGLRYIHAEGIVHGDLRGVISQIGLSHLAMLIVIFPQANILISLDERALIADFGLSIYADVDSNHYSSTRGGNARWLAPEIAYPGDSQKSGRPTYEGDIYSFAMSCIQVSTRLLFLQIYMSKRV